MLALLAALSALPTCRSNPGDGVAQPADMPMASIEEVLRRHTPGWMTIPGVAGTGIGLCDGEPCLTIFATERTPEIEAQIPSSVDGYPVRVEVTGSFRARRGSDAAP